MKCHDWLRSKQFCGRYFGFLGLLSFVKGDIFCGIVMSMIQYCAQLKNSSWTFRLWIRKFENLFDARIFSHESWRNIKKFTQKAFGTVTISQVPEIGQMSSMKFNIWSQFFQSDKRELSPTFKLFRVYLITLEKNCFLVNNIIGLQFTLTTEKV